MCGVLFLSYVQKDLRSLAHSEMPFQTLGDIRTLPFNEKYSLMKTMSDTALRQAAGWSFKIFQKQIKLRKENYTTLKFLCAVMASVDDGIVNDMKREIFAAKTEMVSPNDFYVSNAFVCFRAVFKKPLCMSFHLRTILSK